ncbi:hypothetical protein C3F09_01860 [candidate division GN15 bacterium]|uniref:Zinc-ribbon domain-containing protein n=1 Tax=candidate division GN15 bacterium TaxID=2072418 RepID=A0A855XBY6_9BACT|nr:MAG: hypothetical protein C3F09_01860 [candidate division GN15 bacterium]
MTNIKCPSCQAEIPANARFCPECGASLSGEKPAGAPANSRIRDVGIIVGVLVVMTAAYFILRSKPAPQPTAGPSQSAAAQQDMPPDHPPVEGMAGMPGMDALESLPKSYDSLVMLGNQNMDHGQLAIAAECYRRALAIDSTQVDVRVDYGACLHGMGMADRAIQEFQKALKMAPQHAIANFNLGIVYMDLQQKDSAKVYFQKYLQLEPNGRAAADAGRLLKQVSE